MLRKLVLVLVGAVVIIGTGAYVAFQISPWPSVLMIRYAFHRGAIAAADSIVPLVPSGVSMQRDLSYDVNGASSAWTGRAARAYGMARCWGMKLRVAM
jgi:acetyl esterase